MSSRTRAFFDAIKSGAEAVVNEAIMPALEKAIPQGAAELTQAMFTGNSYVPYGPTEKPMEQPEQGLDNVLNGRDEKPAVEQQREQERESQGREM